MGARRRHRVWSLKSLGLVKGKKHLVDGLRQAVGNQPCVRYSDSCVEAGFAGGEAGSGRPARRLTASTCSVVGPGLELQRGAGRREGCEMERQTGWEGGGGRQGWSV